MNVFAEIVVAIFIVVGASFGLVGSWGLLRLPHLMARLHAPTKATTLGVGSVLLASMVYFLATGEGFSVHEVLIVLFLFLTAPVSASFIARAYLRAHVDPAELPGAGEQGWASFVPRAGDGGDQAEVSSSLDVRKD